MAISHARSKSHGAWPIPSGLTRLAVVVIGVLGLSIIRGVSPEAAASPSPALDRREVYVKDLQALFEALDAQYGFFRVKGLEKEWARAKPELLKRATQLEDDTQFAELLVEVLRELRDGHCGFTELEPKLPPVEEYYPGVALAPFHPKGGKKARGAVVLWGDGSLAQVLPPGSIVTRIDGKPAHLVLDRAAQEAWAEGGFFSSPQRARFFCYRTPCAGPRGEKHTFHYLDGRKEKKVSLVNQYETRRWAHNFAQPDLTWTGKSVAHSRLDPGIGYVYLRKADDDLESGLRQARAAHPEVRGWIFDLRGNTGGGYDSGTIEALKQFSKPVIAIIDAGCISAGETLARDLVRNLGAKLIGETTAGSSSTKTTFRLPSGLATIRFSTASRNGTKGPIEFHGIEPDVEVFASPEILAAGKNTEIEYARRLLLEETSQKR